MRVQDSAEVLMVGKVRKFRGWSRGCRGYRGKKFKIFNIRTNEIQELNADMEELDFIVISLLQGKYQKVAKLSDEEFLEGNRRVF